MRNKTYKNIFSGEIRVSIKTAMAFLSTYPVSASALYEVTNGLKKSEVKRQELAKEGLEVPPLMIVSTTDECNLSCKGCYSCQQERTTNEELSEERINQLLDEASSLGVSILMLAGGEPLLSQNWLDAASNQNNMLSIIFTNGILIDEQWILWFAEHRNCIPVISIEGNAEQTDERRGEGVSAKVYQVMDKLSKSGIPFGISITITSENIDSILKQDFTTEYFNKGCRLFVYVEYVPAKAGTEPLILTKADKKRLNDFAISSANKNPALFIPFPGDEELFGGCLAAGRGFVHISAGGAVEPCPFAPFSDVNLKDVSLKSALSSNFLAKVRKNHHLLKEGDGGCALWSNKKWLQEMFKSSE